MIEIENVHPQEDGEDKDLDMYISNGLSKYFQDSDQYNGNYRYEDGEFTLVGIDSQGIDYGSPPFVQYDPLAAIDAFIVTEMEGNIQFSVEYLGSEGGFTYILLTRELIEPIYNEQESILTELPRFVGATFDYWKNSFEEDSINKSFHIFESEIGGGIDTLSIQNDLTQRKEIKILDILREKGLTNASSLFNEIDRILSSN